MTETTLAKVDRDPEVALFLGKALMIVLMVFGAICAGSLLHWAVTKKLTSIETPKTSDITVAVRERQLTCLARNIYYEAGSEPFEGKVAVAQVTINRTESGLFPKDICNVVMQKNVIYEKVICQFSWYCDRTTMLRPVNGAAYEESMNVAKKVLLEGFRLPGLHNALYYHADYVNPGWRKQKITKIGRHIFYQ